ncbi:MAG: GNAT family N-acetyltransferase [Pseudodesulfovibrio sp.]|uniref:GCN5-related N-acetyltransferase n=1 Tax=Pseudodesulfovibrio aespoeensis (strain ATCC 700646 / DSM 10631 / Aspo-2) TaxID=643562 RepID=E6VRY9_PSEA9|nr:MULTISPECIES: GNAT family N-acetyltransferase [Pseudodesulfovibrio]MBU4191270.1 GNAT family N-acetyltransferase [Pseudomonadota bacterium]ADU61922.1 GCN5-related N-acetyltransferase [Pseudodesulfovibrio aespoeensis Aspo-2]MBU4244670.1 GNAT family N-acetyltransferase [Pseudomonadota bacterium]MBU4473725.1 GNAT family N-acetyltransferase [Pseudomonadota bacterium]MBU4514674.1 GNAT family N-acetyltransferase [Pseudomonadota bacterium]
MSKSLQTQLRVPAQGRLLALVQGYVRQVSETAGLAGREVAALELAAEEAFLNICDHAYPDGTRGDVLIGGEIRESELVLDFRDEGLPFDPSLLRAAEPESSVEPSVESVVEPGWTGGLGLKLIRHAVDEVSWINHGRQGKSLCLVKRLPGVDALAESGRAQAQPMVREEVAQAPMQRYETRAIQPGEAMQVARIFWLAYGYSYKNEAFYRPEGMLHLVGTGKLISFVAVAEDGDVAGHAGLLRPEPVPMAELALLVVSPAHRGRKIMDSLFEALVARAREMELFGLALNPVTSHPISQRQSMEAGGKPCGLDLAACPPRQFKGLGLDDKPRQRESYLHCFMYLTTPPVARVHVPARHREMVERIYANLDRLVEPLPLTATEPDGAPGDYSVSFDMGLKKGVIRVRRADERQWSEIRRAAIDLVEIAGAEKVDIDLPLAQAATPILCERAEEAGFFFAGIWPHGAEDGDMLRLTRLAAPFDLGHLRLHSDFANALSDYVGREMKRAGLPASGPDA